ncbi:flagellar biosynthesis protein FlhB [Neobacillus massiliamazoniensis]|uniref:Flagellar biosynthetic protein FlhB n=1 Tax=Neobacillus massiliamazoniensis TaxID=1499688 RepID=A0A0U1NS65_9BACI|nr:flagellar biosynthesis protein FlhB [Neobacillus massiliamazoniensis]CRK80901.1 flagellar biosynthetic protein FlhB [Neobacillus massiliamazoniensis]
MSGEKTEKATPHKRREARKKGQVAKSAEVSSSLTLLLCFAFFMIAGKSIVEGCMEIYRRCFQEYMLWDISYHSLQLMFKQILWEAAKLLGPFFAIVLVVGLFANFLQVGFNFNIGLLKMNFGKLNPIQGAKNIFSIRSLVELVKALLKITITSGIAFAVIWNQKTELFSIGQKSIYDAARLIGSLILQLGLTVAGCLVVLAAADFFYQRFEFEKKLRMSKQEIKEEYKKMEGDPVVKGKRRAQQRKLSMSRMMQELPKADVVITNPTHFAVAIRYDVESMDAPEVIAKGKDHIALKIKEIAAENKIMTVENKPLARALFASVEIGDTIPEELFNAVAEILAYVYYQEGRFKGRMA